MQTEVKTEYKLELEVSNKFRMYKPRGSYSAEGAICLWDSKTLVGVVGVETGSSLDKSSYKNITLEPQAKITFAKELAEMEADGWVVN